MRFEDHPELHAALIARDAAEEALAAHTEWMKERYGYRGVPPGAPEALETGRLSEAAWAALKQTIEVSERLRAERRRERFDRVTKAIDNTVERFKLTKRSRMTAQEQWDHQIERNRDPWPYDRRAVWADRFGMTRIAESVREDIDARLRIAAKMERCPNNPRNGGDGFDRGDGKWTDRRTAEWDSVEGDLELGRRLAQLDPLSSESHHAEVDAHRAEVARRIDEWARDPDNPRNWGRRVTESPREAGAQEPQEAPCCPCRTNEGRPS